LTDIFLWLLVGNCPYKSDCERWGFSTRLTRR